MSLQVWLPLNGDLHNQGLQLLPNLSYNTFTIQNDGKIGKCYSGQGVYHLSQDFLNNEWSLCTWVKSSQWSQYNDILLCKNTSSSDNCQFYFSIVNGNTLNLGINAGSGSTSFNYTFAINTWYHVAATYDGNEYALYINGELKKSGIISNALKTGMNNLGINCRSNNNNGTDQTGDGGKKLNDVRIYNHALSDKEVEEIAKGLILHYKLDNDNNANYGWLLPNNERTITRSSGNTFIDYEYFSDLILNTETNYIVDFDAKGSVPDMGLDLYFRNSSGSGYAVVSKQILTTEYQHYSLELVGSPSALQLFRARCYGGVAGDIIYLKNVKLLSNNMPIRNNIIYDSSGYNNNGIIIGQVETSGSTPKYSICTYINSPDPTTNSSTGEYYISANCGLTTPSTISIAWWANPESGYGGGISHAMWCTTANDIASDYTISAFNHRDTRFDVNSSDDQHLALSTSSFVANAWHHYVVTYDGQTARLYKDGVQQTSVAFAAAKTLGTFTKILIGHSRAGGVHRKMKGKYSDFRVYATCLTQETVLELYHTSATIDNNGNVYAREVIE